MTLRRLMAGLAAAVLALGVAGCSNGQAEQAGREFGQQLRSEGSNFTQTNRSLYSQASEHWSWQPYTPGESRPTQTMRSWTAMELRARIALVIGLSNAAQLKTSDLSRAQLHLPDGREVADVVLWQQPGTDRTYAIVRASVPSAYARPDSAMTVQVHTNDDPTNGEGCRTDAKQAPSTWFASADGVWAPGHLPALELDKGRTATPVWTITEFTREQVEGKVLILYGQNGVHPTITASTRLACGVIGGF